MDEQHYDDGEAYAEGDVYDLTHVETLAERFAAVEAIPNEIERLEAAKALVAELSGESV